MDTSETVETGLGEHSGSSTAVEEILRKLEPWQARELLHLLVCPTCGGAAGRELLALQPDVIFASEAGGAKPEAVGHSGELKLDLDELRSMRAPEIGRWLQRLERMGDGEEGIRNLFDICRMVEATDPTLAIKVAKRARERVERLRGEGQKALRARALVLHLNAIRLAGADYGGVGAEDAIREGWPLVEHALVARAYAVICWERGEVERAESLLTQTLDLFSRVKQREEEGVTSTLVGLLLEEQGRTAEAFTYLVGGLTSMSPSRTPWLAARGTYCLALVLTDQGANIDAWRTLSAGKALRHLVKIPTEMVVLDGLEAVVEARLEGGMAATSLLARTSGRLAQEGRVAEALLATVDLCLTLAELGREVEIEGAVSRIERLVQDREVLDRAQLVLQGGWTGTQLRERKVTARRQLLQDFRTWGPRPRPLPLRSWFGELDS